MNEEFLFNVVSGGKTYPVYRAGFYKMEAITPFVAIIEKGPAPLFVEEPNVQLYTDSDGNLCMQSWKSDTPQKTLNHGFRARDDQFFPALAMAVRILLEPPGNPINLKALSVSERVVMNSMSMRQVEYIYKKATEGVE